MAEADLIRKIRDLENRLERLESQETGKIIWFAPLFRIVGPSNTTYGAIQNLAANTLVYYPIEGTYTMTVPGNRTITIPSNVRAALLHFTFVTTTAGGTFQVFNPDSAFNPTGSASSFYPANVGSEFAFVKLGIIPSGPNAGKKGIAVLSTVAVTGFYVDMYGYTV